LRGRWLLMQPLHLLCNVRFSSVCCKAPHFCHPHHHHPALQSIAMAFTQSSANAAATIASSYCACKEAFSDLFKNLSNGDLEFAASLPGFQKELGRFKVWAENAGAHRTGRMSLDHRLREASNVKNMAVQLLGDLNSDLREGDTPCWTSAAYSSLMAPS
jgi:hypothetical protein